MNYRFGHTATPGGAFGNGGNYPMPPPGQQGPHVTPGSGFPFGQTATPGGAFGNGGNYPMPPPRQQGPHVTPGSGFRHQDATPVVNYGEQVTTMIMNFADWVMDRRWIFNGDGQLIGIETNMQRVQEFFQLSRIPMEEALEYIRSFAEQASGHNCNGQRIVLNHPNGDLLVTMDFLLVQRYFTNLATGMTWTLEQLLQVMINFSQETRNNNQGPIQVLFPLPPGPNNTYPEGPPRSIPRMIIRFTQSILGGEVIDNEVYTDNGQQIVIQTDMQEVREFFQLWRIPMEEALEYIRSFAEQALGHNCNGQQIVLNYPNGDLLVTMDIPAVETQFTDLAQSRGWTAEQLFQLMINFTQEIRNSQGDIQVTLPPQLLPQVQQIPANFQPMHHWWGGVCERVNVVVGSADRAIQELDEIERRDGPPARYSRRLDSYPVGDTGGIAQRRDVPNHVGHTWSYANRTFDTTLIDAINHVRLHVPRNTLETRLNHPDTNFETVEQLLVWCRLMSHLVSTSNPKFMAIFAEHPRPKDFKFAGLQELQDTWFALVVIRVFSYDNKLLPDNNTNRQEASCISHWRASGMISKDEHTTVALPIEQYLIQHCSIIGYASLTKKVERKQFYQGLHQARKRVDKNGVYGRGFFRILGNRTEANKHALHGLHWRLALLLAMFDRNVYQLIGNNQDKIKVVKKEALFDLMGHLDQFRIFDAEYEEEEDLDL